MTKILFILFIVFLAGCSFEERIFLAEEEIQEPAALLTKELGLQQVAVVKRPKAAEKVVFYIWIKNDAKVNLTLGIRKFQLNDKALASSQEVLSMLEKEILPELELNQSQNKDITMGRWKKRMDLLDLTWSKYVSAQEKKDLLHELEATWNMVGVPKEAKDEELLETPVVQNLALFFQGIVDALKPYREISATPGASSAAIVTQETPKKDIAPEKVEKQVESQQPKEPEKFLPIKEDKPPIKETTEPKLPQAVPAASKAPSNIQSEPKATFEPKIQVEPNVKLAPEVKWDPELKIFGE